jgi:hypothetical protein
MTLLLNIVLLLVGTAATLAAFGGKTWNEGAGPIEKRITPRGWFSLVCLSLALIIGTIKEFRTQQDQADKDHAAKEAKMKSDMDQMFLRGQIAEANARAGVANAQLKGLQRSSQDTEHRLGDAKETLKKTQDELDRQGDVNLVTALANSDQRVTDIQFIIPFTSKGTKGTTFHDVFLPKDFSPACRKDTEVDVGLWVQTNESQELDDAVQVLRYSSDDDKPSHAYFTELPLKVDALFYTEPTLFGDDAEKMMNIMLMKNLAGQKTTNLHAATFVVHVAEQNESAAHFLFPPMGLTAFPIYVSALTPYDTFILNMKEDEEQDVKRQQDKKTLSVVCDSEVQKYFSVAFEKAYVGITLSHNKSMTIYLRLKAIPPINHMGTWAVSFAVDSKPLIFVNDQFAGLLSVKWPDKPVPTIAPHR